MHYWIHQLKKLPSEYLSLPRLDKAFVIASIQVKIDAEKKARAESENKAKRGRGRKGKKR